MVENITIIKENGMTEFLAEQAEKYRCLNCREVVSVHDRNAIHAIKQVRILNQKILKKQYGFQPRSSEHPTELNE